MRFFFWIVLASILAGLLVRIPFGGGGILLSDLLAPMFGIFWVGRKILLREKFFVPRIFFAGFIFVFIGGFGFLLGAADLQKSEIFLGFFHLVRFISFLIFGVAAAEIFAKNPKSFFPPAFCLSFGLVFLGFLQFYFFPDLAQISTIGGFDPHSGRMTSSFLDPNYFGGFVVFWLPILVAFFYRSPNFFPFFQKGRKIQILFLGLIILFLGSIFLTFSRSAYLAAAAALFIFFFFRDRKMILLGILCVAISILSSERAQKRLGEFAGTVQSVVFFDTDEIDPTAQLRLQSWRQSLEIFAQKPLLGVGYNHYRAAATRAGMGDANYFSGGGADSTFLTILVTTGVLGAAAFFAFLASIWISIFRRFLSSRNEVFLGFVAGFSGVLVHAIFVNSLLFPLIFLPIVATAGVLAGARKKF